MFHAQELGSYSQGQGSLAVFKVTTRDQGHYKGPSGAFVTYCNISCFFVFLFFFFFGGGRERERGGGGGGGFQPKKKKTQKTIGIR